ncbi:MSHA biogenesis protein MshA [Vibrio sp. UCD-FRSSP16_10]|uniref:type II secretion system protein n=1 Tax=unclassified Vibrio TaxID=2614977 RepID=UPI0007FC5F0C|nr:MULTISPECIES: type II secretion system protein [unclassified Vibrio]OBT13491.1 MSHA biogenesis protein MshA [Vibrio sp. UCD-FRSSP16_10]OBT18000.1 MSHA biogenesis protein MshA [Vibrio sp. UCD-FRSSP16_30]
MQKKRGFTLIELVVVIVILGILAVTAAPRFLNLQSDARESSLQGLKGAMLGAGSIVYSRSAIEGVETLPSHSVDNIDVVYGYPAATSTGIGAAVDGLQDDWVQIIRPQSTALATNKHIAYTFKDFDSTVFNDSDGCFVLYNEATSVAVSSVVIKDNKC